MQEQMEKKFMKNEEIKEICAKNNLTRMEVYDIRSQFTSMCMISEGFLGAASEETNEEQSNDKANNSRFKEPQKEGIPLNFFIKNCSFLAGTLPHISKRLIAAKGVDIASSNSKIDWETFLQIYCIFETGNIDKEGLIDFWIKFFDPKLIGFVSEHEYMILLEELIRGNSLAKPSETTKMFARMFQKLMSNAGCLGDNKEIITDKLKTAFMTDKIDIKALGCSLGRQKLDDSIMKIEL
jgi:hypothetical protein